MKRLSRFWKTLVIGLALLVAGLIVLKKLYDREVHRVELIYAEALARDAVSQDIWRTSLKYRVGSLSEIAAIRDMYARDALVLATDIRGDTWTFRFGLSGVEYKASVYRTKELANPHEVQVAVLSVQPWRDSELKFRWGPIPLRIHRFKQGGAIALQLKP